MPVGGRGVVMKGLSIIVITPSATPPHTHTRRYTRIPVSNKAEEIRNCFWECMFAFPTLFCICLQELSRFSKTVHFVTQVVTVCLSTTSLTVLWLSVDSCLSWINSFCHPWRHGKWLQRDLIPWFLSKSLGNGWWGIELISHSPNSISHTKTRCTTVKADRVQHEERN